MSNSNDTPAGEHGFGHLFEGDRAQLKDIFGEEWRDCITPYGANKLLATLSEARAKQPDPIEDGDECPVCGEEIRNAYNAMEGLEGESVSAKKVCVVDFPDESIIHFDDDRVDDPSELAESTEREDV